MTPLVFFTVAYLVVTVAIGLYAAKFVSNSKDYLVAGRNLPLYMNVATVFATWFGAETVLSVSATFVKDGLGGIPADPFGATFCLIFVALFFARAFYRLDLLTIGDFYKKRYGKGVEVLTSLAVTLSYLGWTSAQLTALGIVFNARSQGAVTLDQGIIIGAVVVLIYTTFGGMWAVALTDLFQSFVIVIGLFYVAYLATGMAGGVEAVVTHASAAGKFEFWPKGGSKEWWAFVAAWATLAIGSIPQQDVFQRVTSARNENTAVRGSLLGAGAYFLLAFVPMYLAYSALLVNPEMVNGLLKTEGREVQLILPNLVLMHMPLFAQVMFFGALLSAILSTSSGALLAPTALFTENVVKPLFGQMGDKRFLLALRLILVGFTAGVLVFALNNTSTMYEMVQNAYKVTLVGAFVPLACGIYWHRATTQGALVSALAGLAVWVICERFFAEADIPPQMWGLFASVIGMLVGSFAPQLIRDARQDAFHRA
ncbi:MAG TPA: sodium:solute symporter family protein [Usitatibacteraceae bacterium]|nr:sodium:solute symporter family protein [Usitatibacteraceae bacterium]